MDKTFNPQAIEQPMYEHWEQQEFFKPADDQGQGHFCIMIPPPNVTGSLHMGHAFQNTIMDILTRYHRMIGKRTLWVPGTDHAGIATQILVERRLEAQGKTRLELGREKFIEEVWKWKAESGKTITSQIRRLGSSADWSRERFTMDEGLSYAVREVFIQLYRDDLIYRGKRLVNWDPKLNSSVSDLEVTSTEEPGHLWHFRYPIVTPKADQPFSLVVATTRPETMFGDAAIAVHPDDERYKSLIGGQVELPLTNRLIPIIADEYVDPEFGTGCVKITPAHDFNDYAVGQRHQLPLIEVMNLDGTLNSQVPEAYQGLDRFEARNKLVDEMNSRGLLERIEPHTIKVPRGERTGVIIEPMLTSQWFVRTQPLAEPAIAAVESGNIQFIPKNWENTYYAWMNNIQDWCISRQLWWGHRIPAWYDDDGKIYVGQSEEDVRRFYSLDDRPLHQDEDVLDTWFSSALWTFSPLGWPADTEDLRNFHPTSVLVTGFDIIFFWVARMIMFSLKFKREVPFHKVYIHGLIRDGEGQKMSKSKGNVLDPLDLINGIDLKSLITKRTANLMQPNMAKKIEKATRKEFPNGINAYGTDALRFTFCALASQGRHIRFDIARIEGYRNFCNKLWNAARFVEMTSLQNQSFNPGEKPACKNLADQWILHQLQEVIEKAHTAINTYRFDILAQTLHHFVWHEYCDWYLELAKVTLYAKPSDPAATLEMTEIENHKRATQLTCIYVLESILRLLHPIMPFITEAIWQTLRAPLGLDSDTIMHASYPNIEPRYQSDHAAKAMNWTQDVITGLREIRGEMNIPRSKKITVRFQGGDTQDKVYASEYSSLICALAQVSDLLWLQDGEESPAAATHLVGQLQVLVPLEGLIDVAEEQARLEKNMEKLKKELTKAESQINNERFVANAPAEVVLGVKAIITDSTTKLKQYEEQLQQIKAMAQNH